MGAKKGGDGASEIILDVHVCGILGEVSPVFDFYFHSDNIWGNEGVFFRSQSVRFDAVPKDVKPSSFYFA